MRLLAIATLAALLGGCALRPSGESQERDRAAKEGHPYEESAPPPSLGDRPGPDDYLHFAFVKNADLEARYWEWRSALEQIPQDSSWPNPAVSFSYMFSKENMKAWDRTTLGVFNDPMTNIPFPTKLATAGRAALENARATGRRFEEAKFLLQAKVLTIYYDLALLGESLRIQRETVVLLKQVVGQAETRVQAGTASQQDLLKAQTEFELAENDLKNLESRVPPLVARMNALLGRPAGEAVPLPAALPEPRPVPVGDADLIRLGSERSPELAALADEIAGRKEALSLARQAYIPDFGLSFSVNGSIAKTLGAMVTLPFRLEAIRGGIEQARANLRATEAARTQYGRDLAASFVLNLVVLRNDERQISLFEKSILPRTRQTIEVAQASYAAGKLTFLELLDSQRTYLDVRLTLAELKTEREKALAAIETWSAVDVEAMGARRATGGRSSMSPGSGSAARPMGPGNTPSSSAGMK
jgi:outer membrane protein TolC